MHLHVHSNYHMCAVANTAKSKVAWTQVRLLAWGLQMALLRLAYQLVVHAYLHPQDLPANTDAKLTSPLPSTPSSRGEVQSTRACKWLISKGFLSHAQLSFGLCDYYEWEFKA